MKNLIDNHSNSSTHATQADVAYQMTMALSNLNGHYKKEIHSYVEELQQYIFTIEKYKNEILLQKKSLKPQEDIFEALKHDISYDLRILERSNNKFLEDSKLLIELKSFLGDDNHKERFLEKQNTLQHLLVEIKEIEKTLLIKELEKQNILLKMKPLLKKIEILESDLNKVVLEKNFMESTKIHQISQQEQLQFMKNEAKDEDGNTIIDTDVS
jgi:hypothetical protein